jgi:hypothetical protein
MSGPVVTAVTGEGAGFATPGEFGMPGGRQLAAWTSG